MAGGECTFDESYNTNNLVNAMAVGIAKKDKIFYSAATQIGGKVVYFGSKTGRDGIHGASMSSDSFDSNAKVNKPTVQIGDPFVEKLLIEACLELMQSGCVLSIQDMGAAGLTCSCAEMAGKGGNGIEIDVALVPLRDSEMNAYEIMLSESQERMLMILKDGMEERAAEILKKWSLDFAIIGKITDTKRFIIKENGTTVCNLPIQALSEEAPIYDRPYEIKIDSKNHLDITKSDSDFMEIFKKIVSSPNLLNKSFIWNKYDRGVGNRVIFSSPEPSGLIAYGSEFQVEESHESKNANYLRSQILLKKVGSSSSNDKSYSYKTRKAVAMTSVCNSRFVLSNPKEGAKQAVAESYRNLCSVGAKPLAITNCLNFGNPEIPEIMGQIVGVIEGISEAAKALDYPVVSGNVSLYNQTNNSAINPTPTIGGVGIMKDYFKSCSSGFKQEEDFIFVIGETKGHMTNTFYATEIECVKGGVVPAVDLSAEKHIGNFIRESIQDCFINACSDVGNGGIAFTLAKMALNSENKIGCILDTTEKTAGLSLLKYMFSEDGARYICAVPKELSSAFIEKMMEEKIIFTQIGFTTKDIFELNSEFTISIEELKELNTFKGFS
jgi:phosphoribosylformylglycinamidine synthase